MSYETIRYEPAPVARIVLDRPEVLNAQSRSMLRELDDAFHLAAADTEVRVVVVSGSGRAFSAGHDIKEMGLPENAEEPAERYERMRVTYAENHLAWRNLPKPTIAMVHGYCVFGGWMVASAMDLVFASEDAQFLALPYPADYWSVTWELGQRKTKEILFANRFITAREAMELGFVNQVHPAEALEPETLAYAEMVAENDPMRLRNLKLIVNQTMDGMGFTQSVQAAFHGYGAATRSTPSDGSARGSSLQSQVQQAMRNSDMSRGSGQS